MLLIKMSFAYLSFGDNILLNNAELYIKDNERICLVGCNGSGKSTLMRILSKEQLLDNGEVIYQQYLQVSHLHQNLNININNTVFDFITEGAKDKVDYIKYFYKILKIVKQNPSKENLNKLTKIQLLLDQNNLWSLNTHIHNIIKQLQLLPDSKLSTLSGGCLRKAAIARALVCNPKVFFLDEPTNHLDIDTILWLEDFLKKFNGSIFFSSHDRSFIRNVATRIINIDRGKLISWSGNYNNYLIKKEKSLQIEAQYNIKYNYKLSQEEIWINSGIKARRTRNKGRVNKLKLLREEYLEKNYTINKLNMHILNEINSGNKVFELKNIYYYINNKILINNFSIKVKRGDKIALIGINGCGKTTLLKLILGELKVNSGYIYYGTNLKIAYFDQHRIKLNYNETVINNLTKDKEEIIINGKSRHIFSYLKDFLFNKKQAMMLVSALSGGEKNRLLLACLFSKSSNLLILDEPTNDLDIETLELLEELIYNYQGTVLLVSHDRQFVDNTMTEYWIFKDYGKIERYLGSFDKAYLQLKKEKKILNPIIKNNIIPKVITTKELKFKNNKINYIILKELKQLPYLLEIIENEIINLQSQINNPNFFNQSYKITNKILKKLAKKEIEMESTLNRWQELDLLNYNQLSNNILDIK